MTAPLAAAGLALLPYLQALRHGYVSFDDPQMIEGNPLVTGESGALAAFTSLRMTSWQPLGWLLYRVLHALGGGSPAPFHAAAIGLHALNAGLLAALLLRLLPKAPVAAALGALLWAWHPVQVESVAWASQLSDVLCATFVLAGLLLRAHERRSEGIALFALACLCRWKAIVFLPLAFVLDEAMGKKRKAWEYAVLACLSAALVAINAMAKATGGYAASFRWGVLVEGFSWQLGKIFMPLNLAPSHVFQGSPSPISWVVLIGFISFAVYAWRRSRALLFALLAFAISLAPTLIAVRPGAVPLYDHHLYMPLCLFAAAAAVSLPRWPLAAVVLALGVGSSVQASHWKDSESLWARVLSVYPESQTARYNLALSRGSQGRWLDALLAVDAQLSMFPADKAASDFRAILLDRAAPEKGQRARLLSDAASSRFESGDAAGAAATLQEARALAPKEPMILVNSAIAAAALGKREEARLYLKRALSVSPGFSPAKEALARLEAAK